MSFKVVMVANPDILVEDLPENIKATGAELSLYTACAGEDELISMCLDA